LTQHVENFESFKKTKDCNYGIIKPQYKEADKMPQIIPIKDLKNTADISEMVHAAEEPIYITKNGYGQ
jgi:hypothetical protein